jgi:hypothetical protein
VSDRFDRKIRRATMDWTVEVQSLIDREHRRLEKVVRRLRRNDPELAERLRSALAEVVVDDEAWPQRTARLLRVAHDSKAADLHNQQYRDEVVRAVERGVGRVARLEPPTGRASWHAAVVTAQREYEVAMRQFFAASGGRDETALAAAAHRVEQARRAIDASMSAAAEQGH